MKKTSLFILVYLAVFTSSFSQFITRKNSEGELEKGMLKEGIKLGCWVYYNQFGEILRLENYNEQGRLHGYSNFYSNDGRLHAEKWYNNGVLEGTQTQYHNGKKLKEYGLIHSKFDGPYMTFYVNGNPDSAGIYKDGIKVSAWVNFYENGNKRAIWNYNNQGIKEGKEQYFYQNGSINMEFYWNNNLMHGKYTQFHKSGSIEMEGNYVNGQRVGIWNEYDATGRRLKSTNYKKQ